MKQILLNLVQETVDTLGYTLIESHYENSRGKNKLKVIISKKDNLSTEDCSKVASVLSRRLDVEDVIPDAYDLIVESPGVEYFFKKNAHYDIFKEKEVLMTIKDFTKYGIKDPVLQGINKGIQNDKVIIKNTKNTFEIDLSDISKCRLYFDIKKYL